MKRLIIYFVIICFNLACPGMAILPETLAANMKNAKMDYPDEIIREQLAPLTVVPLSNRNVDTIIRPLEEYPEQLTIGDVTSNDISTSGEVIIITTEIELKAAELNYDAKKMLEWVKFNVDYEPYYGSMKGSSETFIDMAGNDCDQASLLIALLRVSEIPAKYVGGNVTLDVDTLMNWTGGETPEAAIKILRNNGIPTSTIYKFGVPVKVVFAHIWVSAFIGRKWVIMDPSFKTYEYIEASDIFKVDGGVASSIFSNISGGSSDNMISLNLNGINAAVNSITPEVETLYGDLTAIEAFGERKIVVKEEARIATYLFKGIDGDKKPVVEYSELPDSMKFWVKIGFLDYYGNPYGAEYETTLSEVIGKRISLRHVPATDQDKFKIDDADGIYNVDAYTVNMRPEVYVDGKLELSGNSKTLGRSVQYIRTSFLRPGSTWWEDNNKVITSGNTYNISIALQKTSVKQATKICDKIMIAAENADLGDDGILNEKDQDAAEILDDVLYLGGKLYFTLVDHFMYPSTQSLDIVNVGHISLAYVCDEVEPVGWNGYGYTRINRGGAHLDVVRSVSCPTSKTGNEGDEIRWRQTSGCVGSNMESVMLELIYGIGALSTGTVICEASLQEVPLIAIDDPTTLETDLALITADETVKNHIRAYINYPFADYGVIIPTQETTTLGDWKGQGWTIVNKDTGASSLMIFGNLQGEITNGAMLVYPSSEDWIPWLGRLGLVLWAAGDTIAIAGTMAIAGGAHMVAATEIMCAASTTVEMVAAVPFVLAGQAIGMALVAVASVTVVYLLTNYAFTPHIMRREDYYGSI